MSTSDFTGIELVTAGRDLASLQKAVQDSRAMLAMQCRLCGQCDLAMQEDA